VFEILIGAASFVAGAIASVVGFGIGSILTPLLSLQIGTRLAVAVVSIPHLAATFVRFWMLREQVDKRVLMNFGIMSAAGGIAGALLHSVATNPALTFLFAALLIFAGLSGIIGYAEKMRFGPKTAWAAGAISGALGGLVGNQGGIRSAALLGFGLSRNAFVATATAVGLVVDAARMPVYLATSAHEIFSMVTIITVSTGAVLAGTFFGTGVLKYIRQDLFHRIVGVVILILGIFMLVRAAIGPLRGW